MTPPLKLPNLLALMRLRRPARVADPEPVVPARDTYSEAEEAPFGQADALTATGGYHDQVAPFGWAYNRAHERKPYILVTEQTGEAYWQPYGQWGAVFQHYERSAWTKTCAEWRAHPLATKPRIIHPANESQTAKAIAAFCTQNLEGVFDPEILDNLASIGDQAKELPLTQTITQGVKHMRAFGFTVFEKQWELRPDGLLGIKALVERSQNQFTFGLDGSLRLLTRKEPIRGIPLHPMQYLLLRPEMPRGNPWGESYVMDTFDDVKALLLTKRDFILYNADYGRPFIALSKDKVGMGQGVSRSEKLRMLQQFTDYLLRRIFFLDGVKMEWLMPPPGTGENYEAAIKVYKDAIEARWLGASGIIDAQGTRMGGDIATAGTAAHVATDGLVWSKAIQHQLITQLVQANWPIGQRFYPEFVFRSLDARGLESELKVIRVIYESGGAVKAKVVGDRLGYEIVKPDDPEAMQPPAQPGDGGNAGPLPGVEAAGSRRAENQDTAAFAPNRTP